jgi:hypothetical protein
MLEKKTQVSKSGERIVPALVAVVPITPWINNGMKEIDPNIAIPIRKPVEAEVLKNGFENKSSGRIGSLALFSAEINSHRRGMQTPSIRSGIGELKLFSLPICISPRRSSVISTVRIRAPK